MTFTIKGNVKAVNTEYFTCLQLSGLEVQIFEAPFGSAASYLDTASINNDGSFSKEITSTAKAFQLKLYTIGGGGIPGVIVKESPKFCPRDDFSMDFEIDESKDGDPVFDIIITRLTDVGVTDAAGILALTNEELNEIECNTCISEKTLIRLQQAYVLWDEVSTMTIPDTYPEAEHEWNEFISEPDTTTAEERGRRIFFALLKGKNADLGELFTHSREQFVTIIENAITENEIDNGGYASGTNLDYLEGVRDALLLNAANDRRYFDAKVIHLSDNSDSEKSDLLDSALDNGGLNGIPVSEPPDTHLGEAIKVQTISNVLLNYAPFLDAFIADRGREIDYFDLASDGPGALETLITTSGALPPDYADAATYAAAIYENLGHSQPSGRMVGMLVGATSIPSYSDISDLLGANKDFNVRENSAAVFFTTELGLPNSIDETLMEDLLTLQRTSNLTGDATNLNTTATLIDLDLTSSSAIVNMGESAFKDALGGTGTISEEAANRIFSKARGIHESASMMALSYLRYEGPSALMPRSLRTNDLTLPGGALPDNLPDMQDLFGSMNTCTCEHCQSVYSAAAYLTDLLNWLRKDVVHPTLVAKTGLAALETMSTFDRRKDIRHLLLTCKNTNTLLPYIDIVNEILSVELLVDAGYTDVNPTYQITTARKSLQTTKTTEEIMVEPEHRFHDAEDLLQDYFYTWKLPYDVAFDETLSYTAVSGMTYEQVVTEFSPPDLKYDDIRWAGTRLNINPKEHDMLINDNASLGTFWPDYWGSASAITTVGPVLTTTELTISELKEELNAHYINGESMINVVPVEDLCDVDSYTFTPSFTAGVADKLMKFFRLRRRAGLSVWEMDVAIKTLGAGTIDDAFLQKLAACLSFSNDHAISFSDLMVMMGDDAYANLVTASTSDFSVYYQNKFLNKLLPQVIKDFFDAAPYPTNVDALSNEEKQYVATVLGTNIHIIDQVIGDLSLSGSFTTTVLANIHRHVLLLKIFGLDHLEMTSAITFFGDIFGATNKIKAAYDFSEQLARFKTLKISLTDLMDIANGTGDYDLLSLKLIAKAEKSWKSLEKAFQEARKANPDKDATNPLMLPFYSTVLVRDLALQFGLLEANVEPIINEYSGTWFPDFIDDADGTTTARDWTNKETDYKPVYRLLNRIVLLSEILGLEKVIGEDKLEKINLTYPIEIELFAMKDVPGTSPFNWIKNDYTALTATSLAELIWIKYVSRQAATLDMPQYDPLSATALEDFYILVDDYINNTVYYTSGNIPPYQGIFDIYNSLGENSVYKKLTIHEFTEIFRRAREIATDAADIVSIFDSFEKIYNVTQIFNIKVADAWGWVWTSAWTSSTFTAETIDYDMSADIKRTVNGKYPVLSAWSKVIVPVQNGLRSRMRDAFVGLYIAERGFENANEIYNYYLLDTQMAPCMKTSRIVQAISSVQLLVHRGLLNLEAELFIDENDKQEWEWRKNYRVWEANRKVFLYPENWIEPTLRKNKTQLFKAAEELLLQDEINDRNSEQAYSNYLNGLNDVAHLDIRAVYVEDPAADLKAGGGMIYNNNRDEIYHVFARNWNPPYIYYYRKFEDGVWQGWEKMDIEIESDHLVPVMFNRKIYLFFPMFKEKIYEHKHPDPQHTKLHKYYEISVAYTKYDFGKWSQKKIFPEKFSAAPFAFPVFNPKVGEYYAQLVAGFSNKFWDHAGARNDLQNNFFGLWYGQMAPASMDLKDFYFWAENTSNGGLRIHLRRGFDVAKVSYLLNIYSEFAYEPDFVLNPVDERLNFEPDPDSTVTTGVHKFLARPYMTVPYFQQLKHGGTVLKPDWPLVVSPAKLYTKQNPTAGADITSPLLNNASNYILTFPQQFKHSHFKQPFFFNHSKRSYFFRHLKLVDPKSSTA